MKIQVPLSPWPLGGNEIADENVSITPANENFPSPHRLKNFENYKQKDHVKTEDRGAIRTPLTDVSNGIPTVQPVQTKPEATPVHLVIEVVDDEKHDRERNAQLGRIAELEETLEATRKQVDRAMSESRLANQQQPIALHINITEDDGISQKWQTTCGALEKKLEASELINSILSRRILWLQRAAHHHHWDDEHRTEYLAYESAVNEECNTRAEEAREQIECESIQKENERLQSEMMEMEERMDRLRTENRSLSRQLHYISNVLGSHASLVGDVAPSLVRLARELVSFCEKHCWQSQHPIPSTGGASCSAKTPMTSRKKTLKLNAPRRV